MSTVGLEIIKNRLSETTQQAITSVGTATSQAASALADTASKAKLPTINLNDTVVGGLQRSLETSFQTWMQHHPVWAWFVAHPLWSLILLLVLIVLIRGLLGAIAHLTEKVWLAILRAPFAFGTWVFSLTLARFYRAETEVATNEEPTSQQRLTTILDRLDALKTEQEALLAEVRTILSSDR